MDQKIIKEHEDFIITNRVIKFLQNHITSNAVIVVKVVVNIAPMVMIKKRIHL